MNKMPFYFVRIQSGLYLQGVDINEHYCRTGMAPTMGARHSFNEFKTVWGSKPRAFDYRTLGGYINILLSEYQWEDRLRDPFAVIPCDENGKEL